MTEPVDRIRLQTRLPGFKGKTLNVGSEQVTVDNNLCVEVTRTDADRLLAGANWSETVRELRQPPPARTPTDTAGRGRPVRTAQDLPDGSPTIEPVSTAEAPPPPPADALPDAEDPVDGDFDTSSPHGKYEAAVLEHVCETYDVEGEDVLAKSFQMDEAGAKTGALTAEQLRAAALTITEKPTDPAGDVVEEWPWAEKTMPLDYLKRIADAYSVSYAANIGAANLAERINTAMAE